MAKINIENVVASTRLRMDLDLQALALNLEGAVYEPERFPGLVYRLKEPKTATLLFRSGKVVCTGARSVNDVGAAIRKVARILHDAGIEVDLDPPVVVQNIVASADLKQEIDLNKIAVSLGLENVEYEPEQFPGLVYRLEEPKVVLLIFGSGKMVCTGAKEPRLAERGVDNVAEEFRAAGLIR